MFIVRMPFPSRPTHKKIQCTPLEIDSLRNADLFTDWKPYNRIGGILSFRTVPPLLHNKQYAYVLLLYCIENIRNRLNNNCNNILSRRALREIYSPWNSIQWLLYNNYIFIPMFLNVFVFSSFPHQQSLSKSQYCITASSVRNFHFTVPQLLRVSNSRQTIKKKIPPSPTISHVHNK